MSVYSGVTGRSSILKPYSPMERNKAKTAIMNKVRFQMPEKRGLFEVVRDAEQHQSWLPINEYIGFLQEMELNDVEFVRIIRDGLKLVPKIWQFPQLVEALIALPWTRRTPEAVKVYSEFVVDILIADLQFLPFCISKLIALWIPADTDAERWPNGTPDAGLQSELQAIHNLLERILAAIAMSLDVLLDTIEKKYPYFKKPAHVVAGYVHNILWLINYKPTFTKFAVHLILQKLVILDVNASRQEIEEAENDDEDDDEEDDGDGDGDDDEMDEQMFEMDDCKEEPVVTPMNHPIAQTLDICLEKMYTFLDTKKPIIGLNMTPAEKLERQRESLKFFKSLLAAFDNVILPCHNTHHVQFLIFYACTFRSTYAETFLSSLWEKIQNPNVSAVIRQAAVGYMASFLARSKGVSIILLKHYLKELCDWAHQYIERCDQYRANGSLKANIVFFSTCQAIFYVIAFRSRDLTSDKKNLLFLQSLQLSALVTCNLNPLRVCLPAVATAFAGVTRAYQLAYCYTILERNARRKLATVYANETATAEEVLDTFFPFDPYLLKISAARIASHYLQYQASEAEEHATAAARGSNGAGAAATGGAATGSAQNGAERADAEMFDDVDDFLVSDKRQKFIELARSQEREAQFTYGLSPGFHT